MKVLQVLFSGLGGHASVVFSMIDGDRKQEWDHHLVFYGTESLNAEHAAKAEARKLTYDVVLATTGKPLKSWRKFYANLKRINPDVVLLHSNNLTIPTWWYCKRHGKKLVVIEHTPNQVKRKVDKSISLAAQYLADRIVLLTEDYRKELRAAQKKHFKEKKVSVIPNGINISLFAPQSKTSSGFPVQLGMAARFSNTKAQDLLINVLSELQKSFPGKFRLSLAGDGDELAAAKKLAEESSLSEFIHFPGNLNEEQLISFFHQLDIYLHASKGETMSTSIMQAMACGLPTIASDIPGINNVLANERGILVSNTVAAYTEAITRLAGERELSEKIASRARHYAEEELSNVKMFDSYQHLLIELNKR